MVAPLTAEANGLARNATTVATSSGRSNRFSSDVGRDVHRGLAGDEDNPSPAARQHLRQVIAGEAHAAQDVGLEDSRPLLVGDLIERLGLVDAQVVDQDVDAWHGGDYIEGPFGRCQISGDAANAGGGNAFLDRADRRIDTRGRAAAHDHRGPFARQCHRDRESDPGGGTAGQRRPSIKLQIHGDSPLPMTRAALQAPRSPRVGSPASRSLP